MSFNFLLSVYVVSVSAEEFDVACFDFLPNHDLIIVGVFFGVMGIEL